MSKINSKRDNFVVAYFKGYANWLKALLGLNDSCDKTEETFQINHKKN